MGSISFVVSINLTKHFISTRKPAKSMNRGDKEKSDSLHQHPQNGWKKETELALAFAKKRVKSLGLRPHRNYITRWGQNLGGKRTPTCHTLTPRGCPLPGWASCTRGDISHPLPISHLSKTRLYLVPCMSAWAVPEVTHLPRPNGHMEAALSEAWVFTCAHWQVSHQTRKAEARMIPKSMKYPLPCPRDFLNTVEGQRSF